VVSAAFWAQSLSQWLVYPLFGGVAMFVLMIFGSGSMPARTVLEAGVDGLRIIRHRPFGTKRIALRPVSVRGFQTGKLSFTIRWESGQWQTLGLSTDESAWPAEALGNALGAPVVIDAKAPA